MISATEIKMTVIDDYTLLFRSPGGVVYVQNPPGGCANISNKTNALTTRRTSSNQLCVGDINGLAAVLGNLPRSLRVRPVRAL